MKNKGTLEEAMEKNGYHDKPSDDLWREGVEFGAKWQQEQDNKMYSEEEAKTIWRAGQEYWKTSGESITFEELIEQFKKK
jgi:hypothetical protein